ncbi:MAG: hypothetical protein JW739_05685 [Opitutales bacterium]|nr:hypothetical protein [Opitutales bacterium]
MGKSNEIALNTAAGTPQALPLTATKSGFSIDPDGWVHLSPFGEFPGIIHGPEGKTIHIIQILDSDATDLMAKNFGEELLLNYDHKAVLGNDRNTVAAAWIDKVEVRENGLWGHVRWTTKGRADVEGGNYRKLSPEFGDFQVLNSEGIARMRPQRLLGAALTNTPNLPLNSVSNQAEAANLKQNMDHKKTLTELLGLAANASDEEIQAAAKAKKEKSADKTDELKAANSKINDLNEKLAVAELSSRGIESTNSAYDVLKRAIVANHDDGCTLADSIAVATQPQTTVVTNSHPAQTPKIPAKGDLARKQDVAVRDHMAANSCSYDQAWNAVKVKHPELFSISE